MIYIYIYDIYVYMIYIYVYEIYIYVYEIYICVCVSYIYIIYPILYQYSIKNVDVSFHSYEISCQPNDSTGRLSVGPVGPLEMEPLRYHRGGHAGSWPWRKHLGDLGDLGGSAEGRSIFPVGFLCFPVVFGLFLLEFCWMMFGIWWCVLMTMLFGFFLI